MGNNYKFKYNVDIVMCIDATGSMGGLINTVKKNALNFYSDLTNYMESIDRHIDQLRVRVIAFRDYLADGEDAMLASDFFALPEEAEDFEALLNSIQAKGGGDDPEDGLEALAYAMKSDWTTGGDKRRHIIVVWSDDGTHELGFGSNPDNCREYANLKRDEAVRNAARYPKKMPRDFEELTDWWGDESQPGLMDNNAKRLLIYAPEKKYWGNISDCWYPVLHFPSEAGKGLEGLEYKDILSTIAHTI